MFFSIYWVRDRRIIFNFNVNLCNYLSSFNSKEIEKESDDPSTKEDCDDESKELEVPKTKIVAKLQEIAEYKRWPDSGRMANKMCWIVKPEVLTDPKWKINDLKELEENGSSWNYILEQPKNVGPGRTPNVNEQSDKEISGTISHPEPWNSS